MKSRHVVSCGLLCAALALAGCDQGRQPLEDVSVRVANAAPSFVELVFQREQVTNETNSRTIPFKGATAFSFDADTYDFYVIERGFPNAPGRTWPFARTLEAGNSYTVVLVENAGNVEPVVVAQTAAAAGSAQIDAVHAALGFPAMDLYLEAPGAGIGGATPRGTVTAGGQLAARTLPNGDYELWLTEAGNPANVLLATGTITLAAADTTTIVIAPEGNQSTAQLSVVLVANTLSVHYDRNATTEVRVINGATDRAPRDFAVNREFSPPLFSSVVFGEPTAYAQTPAVSNINVTPVGNPGVFELDQPFTSFAPGRVTVLFGGPTGMLTHSVVADDGRRFRNEAKLRFFNAASQFTALDLVIANPGEDPTILLPLATAAGPAGAALNYVPIGPGDYDLYLLSLGTTTVVSGPTRVSVAAGGIYGVLATDGPDTATAGILLLDDFP